MRALSFFLFLLAFEVPILLIPLSASVSAAEEEKEVAEELRAPIPFLRAARRYQITRTHSARVATLEERALLHWANPVRKTLGGSVFVWTLDGKPEAVCCMYAYRPPNTARTRVDHELVSLSRGQLQGRYNGELVWSPDGSAVEWKLMAEARSPLKSRRSRLVQMRRLASKFSADMGTRNRRLRLLTQPIHRYPADERRDGAIFAFVQATDPEVLLFFEVERSNAGREQWFYGLTRMTAASLRVRKGDDEVYAVQNYRFRNRHPRETFHVRSDVPLPNIFKESEATE